jgi:hypothetical protein
MASTFSALSIVLASAPLVAAVGCSASSEGDMATADSDLTVPASILGPIRSGETKTGTFTGAPENRAFSFRATGNDTITADINMAGGDAAGFLTDSGFTVLSQSNAQVGPDTRVTFTVPPGPSRPMRIAFKNAAGPTANFRVSLRVQAGACTGEEPWFDYRAKPDECESTSIDCADGQIQFANACGCGCETPLP